VLLLLVVLRTYPEVVTSGTYQSLEAFRKTLAPTWQWHLVLAQTCPNLILSCIISPLMHIAVVICRLSFTIISSISK